MPALPESVPKGPFWVAVGLVLVGFLAIIVGNSIIILIGGVLVLIGGGIGVKLGLDLWKATE